VQTLYGLPSLNKMGTNLELSKVQIGEHWSLDTNEEEETALFGTEEEMVKVKEENGEEIYRKKIELLEATKICVCAG
jgi:hypothetical protein